jgi:hypothetical protein
MRVFYWCKFINLYRVNLLTIQQPLSSNSNSLITNPSHLQPSP